MTFPLEDAQAALRRAGIDGWLMWLLHERNPIAERLLQRPAGQMRSRRAYYWIPAKGQPLRLEHRIECHTLDGLPGPCLHYLSHDSHREQLAVVLRGARRIAMETSPQAALPALSLVDAGTIDLVRDLGVEVLSSAELVQAVQPRLTQAQLDSHMRAAFLVRDIARATLGHVARSLSRGGRPTEVEAQEFILAAFTQEGLETDHAPIVAAGSHAGNPHHEPRPGHVIGQDQVLLIDLWARGREEGAVYADQTWMAFTGAHPPQDVQEAWHLVREARRAVPRFVAERLAEGHPVKGWEADAAARRVIEAAGYGEAFIHRTGHSIDTEVHGRGANLDGLETRDERLLLAGSVMSVEPGLYFPHFGVRSENNLVITGDGQVLVAEGTDQEELMRMA